MRKIPDFKGTSFRILVVSAVLAAAVTTGLAADCNTAGFDMTASAKATLVVKANSVTYRNTKYGFYINLPKTWKGYRILTQKWQGNAAAGSNAKAAQTGPLISIRNPLWTSRKPRQDIPIMIFTKNQWKSVQSEKLVVSAAPVPPSELGHNSKYVFALPARYNYAYLTGYEEVEKILKNNSLHTF